MYIDTWSSSYLDYLVNLKELELPHNQIEIIEDGSFKYFAKLDLLDLSENDNLKVINKAILNGLNNLKSFNISGNDKIIRMRDDYGEMENIKIIQLLISLI